MGVGLPDPGRGERRRAGGEVGSDELGDQRRSPPGAVGGYRPVVDWARELGGKRVADRLRGGGGVVHAGAGAVPVEPVRHVELLLEVVAQWEVEERAALRGQL